MKHDLDRPEGRSPEPAASSGPPPRDAARPWVARLPWARLAAEFGVIFLGVTLGLFADDWRQSQEDREDERRALYELLADLEADSIDLDSLQVSMEVHDASAMWVHQHLGEPEVDSASAALRLAALYPWQAYQAPQATYAGLRSSGRLVLIRDDDLRRSITYYYEERQPYLLQFYETYSDFWLAFRNAASLDVRLVYPSQAKTYGDFERATFHLTTPWDQFPTDPTIRYYVDEIGGLASVIVARIGDVQQENTQLRALIRSQLGLRASPD